MDERPLCKRHPILQETYDELVDSKAQPSDYIVAISGKRATGTSKHAGDLSVEFGIEHVDNGTIQRETAQDYGYDDADTFRAEHPEADVRTDANKLRRAFSGEPLIAEGRLDAAALSADRGDGQPIAAVRIKLVCEDQERARRYAMRTKGMNPQTDVAQAYAEVQEGDQNVYGAFADVYDGIDPTIDAFYDHTVDNTGDYDRVHEQIVDILQNNGFEKRTDLSPKEEAELGL